MTATQTEGLDMTNSQWLLDMMGRYKFTIPSVAFDEIIDRIELLSASKPVAPEGIPDELKQRGLDEHLQRMREQEDGFKSEENVKPHGWKGNPDISPAVPPQSAEPVGSIQRDNIHGFHMEAKVPWDSLPIGTLLYAAPQPSPTAVVLDERGQDK